MGSRFNIIMDHSLCSFCFLVVLLLLSVAATTTLAATPGIVGINYGRIANNLPAPDKVAQLLKSQGITHVKIYDTDSSVLTAFANSGINLVVALPNEQLQSAAKDQSFTDTWLQSNIVPYYSKTQISTIAVGNEVFVDSTNTPFLVPAMTNMASSLKKKNLDIKVSSPIALTALSNSYPPSAGVFKSDLLESVIKPMLDLLRKTNSSLMVNAYPFFAYKDNTDTISLNYALFRNNPGQTDKELKYESLFDAQVDAVHAALKAVSYDDVKVVVSETGWPSKGDSDETGASEPNAAAYNGNLVKKVLTGKGTPLKPNEPLDVYLFALFNENQKTGATSERNYGLYYPDQQRVYDIPVTSEQLASNGSKVQIGAPAAAPAVSAPAVFSPSHPITLLLMFLMPLIAITS